MFATSRAGGGAGGGGGGGDDGGGGGVRTRCMQSFREALQHTLQELAELQDCMLKMNVKMDKMKDVVGLVALGFQVHKLGVTKIDRRLQAVEWRLDVNDEAEDEIDEEEEKEKDYVRGRKTNKKSEFEEQMLRAPKRVASHSVTLRDDRIASSKPVRTATSTVMLTPTVTLTSTSTATETATPTPAPRRDVSLPARAPPAQPAAPAAPAASAAAARPRPRSDQRSSTFSQRSPPPPPSQPPARAANKQPRPSRVANKRRAQLGRQLLQAVEAGSAEEVEKLLNAGADPNFSAARRWVPLHRAARKANMELVSLLLRRGADVHARTSYGFTALHIAAYNDHGGSCAALLVAAGCAVDGKTNSGRTALHAAAETGNAAAARVLVAAGATAWLRDDTGRTPADVARTQELRELLERTASAQNKLPPAPPQRELQAHGTRRTAAPENDNVQGAN